jgi:hypothetical protein
MPTETEDDPGCAYPIDGLGTCPPRACGAPRRRASAYCPEHHARCRLRSGSSAELRRWRESEALAAVVGGRLGKPGREPPPALLRRLARVSRAVLRPKRSLNVLGEGDASLTAE